MAQLKELFVENEVIELRKDGRWYSNGEEISHEETCRAFFRHLAREGDGWAIRIGRESKPVRVEDTAYFVVSVNGSPSAGFRVKTSQETEEDLDPSTLRYFTGRLTCRLASGEEARFLRIPYMDLMKHLQQECDGYYLVVGGKPYRIAGIGAS